MNDGLRLAILRDLAGRGAQSGYARPDVTGYERDDIDTAVDDLRRRYYLEAAYVDAAFGPNPGYWAPSVLTARGRQLLTEMEKSHTA